MKPLDEAIKLQSRIVPSSGTVRADQDVVDSPNGGTLPRRANLPQEVIDKFWNNVARHPGGCWLWTGPVTGSKGYGAVCWNSRYQYAHRLSCEIHHGPIPDGRVVLHLCDNPLCVRPDHLRIGTQGENIRDSVNKGRWLTEKRREYLMRRNNQRDVLGRFLSKDQKK